MKAWIAGHEYKYIIIINQEFKYKLNNKNMHI